MVVPFIKPKNSLKKLYYPFLQKLQSLIIQIYLIKNIKRLYKFLIKKLINTLNKEYFDVCFKNNAVNIIKVQSKFDCVKFFKSSILSNFLLSINTEKNFFWYLKRSNEVVSLNLLLLPKGNIVTVGFIGLKIFLDNVYYAPCFMKWGKRKF